MIRLKDIALSEKLLKAGDRSEIEKLIDGYSDPIYRIGLNITGNAQDADDVLQETIIKVLRNIASFQGKSSLYTWIYRIAVNESLMLLRKGKKVETSIDEEAEGSPTPLEIRSWDPLPEESVIRSETKAKLDDAIKQLSEKLRVVFVLRDMQDMSILETARILDVSEEVVKVRLLRARLALREILTGYFSETR